MSPINPEVVDCPNCLAPSGAKCINVWNSYHEERFVVAHIAKVTGSVVLRHAKMVDVMKTANPLASAVALKDAILNHEGNRKTVSGKVIVRKKVVA